MIGIPDYYYAFLTMLFLAILNSINICHINSPRKPNEKIVPVTVAKSKVFMSKNGNDKYVKKLIIREKN